jgi:hypothetical protein
MENTPNLFPENFFSSLVIGIIYGNCTKNQFILVSQKLFLWLTKPQHNGVYVYRYTNDMWCQWLSQWLCAWLCQRLRPRLHPTCLRQLLHPRQCPWLCIWLLLYYTHGYATWLCPKAMPINNFYDGLYAKKNNIIHCKYLFPYFY